MKDNFLVLKYIHGLVVCKYVLFGQDYKFVVWGRVNRQPYVLGAFEKKALETF